MFSYFHPFLPLRGYLFPRSQPQLSISRHISLAELSKVGSPLVQTQRIVMLKLPFLFIETDAVQIDEIIERWMLFQFAIALEVAKLESSRIKKRVVLIEFSETMKKTRSIFSLIAPSIFEDQQTVSRCFLLFVPISLFPLFLLFLTIFKGYLVPVQSNNIFVSRSSLKLVLFLDCVVLIRETVIDIKGWHLVDIFLTLQSLLLRLRVFGSMRHIYVEVIQLLPLLVFDCIAGQDLLPSDQFAPRRHRLPPLAFSFNRRQEIVDVDPAIFWRLSCMRAVQSLFMHQKYYASTKKNKRQNKFDKNHQFSCVFY